MTEKRAGALRLLYGCGMAALVFLFAKNDLMEVLWY